MSRTFRLIDPVARKVTMRMRVGSTTYIYEFTQSDNQHEVDDAVAKHFENDTRFAEVSA